MINKEKIEKILKCLVIFAIACCCILLLPQVRRLIIEITEKVIGRELKDHGKWMRMQLMYSLFAIFCLIVFLTYLFRKTIIHVPILGNIFIFLHKYKKKLLIFASIAIIVSSAVIITRVMWLDKGFILRTIGTFILFFISFLLMLILILQKIKDWRSSFIVAFISFGVFVYVLTEILSLFKTLTPSGILCGWIFYIVVLLTLFIRLYKKGKIYIKLPQFSPYQWEYGVLAIILYVTFFIAVVYPPNNYDSMTYHLPRIEHWLQNKNLNHYYSSNVRQLIFAPFAEIIILQGRALSGDDYLMNLVQWFSFLGTIIGVSKIAGHLGMNKKMQIITALFFATVPMAILQASSTQTDLVETFCIICMTERLLAWRKTGTLFESITFGIALGLSILTKGTAYPIAFPFVLYFAVICIKYFRKRFIGGCLAAILCLLINMPHYTRNYMVFNNPLGAHPDTVSNFTIKSFVITFFADINSNLAFPIPQRWLDKLNISLNKMWEFIEINDKVLPYGPPQIQVIGSLIVLNEDSAINILHIVLIIIAFIILLSSKKRNMYILLIIGSWCMFAYCIPWQPWITRLQLPLFALSAPVLSLAFENKEKFKKVFIILMISYAILPLVCNRSRPLLHIFGVTNEKKVWNTPRDEFLPISTSYSDACASIVQARIQNLGIIIGEDSVEYPLWRYIRKNSDKKINIIHISEDQIDNQLDALFILDKPIPDSILQSLEINNLDTTSPLVLARDLYNKSEWRILYRKD